MRTKGYVYVVSDGEKCKVGFSTNPTVRVRSLKYTYKMEITDLFISDFSDYALKIESTAHKELSKFIIPDMGKEWFLVDFDEAVEVVTCIDGKQFEPAKMNQAQFNYITAKLNIKPERLQAVNDVIFTDTTATPAERKYKLVRGTIQRDVDRVNNLYNWAIKLKGIR